MKINKVIILLIIITINSCAGPNPNPGERTVDVAWNSNNFDKAFKTAEPHAQKGEPWAQLRLGIFYDSGWGTDTNLNKAEYWYKKAMAQKAKGLWANGWVIGAIGKPGYFNRNSDALIAQYLLAQLYYESNRNLDEAYEHINNVIKESKGLNVFFCCEFSGGRSFTQEQFMTLKSKIEKKLK